MNTTSARRHFPFSLVSEVPDTSALDCLQGRTDEAGTPLDASSRMFGAVPVRQLLVHDTWTTRDLPVLDVTVALLEQSFMVTVTDIATKTGFDPEAVAAALEALDPDYVDFRKTTTGGDPRFWYVYKATPAARRVVGQWPTAEALAGRLADELSAAASEEQDAEHKGLLTYAARLIGDTLRDATVRAAGRVLAPAFGGVPVPELGTPLPEAESREAERLRALPDADLPIHAEAVRQQEEQAEQADRSDRSEPDDEASP